MNESDECGYMNTIANLDYPVADDIGDAEDATDAGDADASPLDVRIQGDLLRDVEQAAAKRGWSAAAFVRRAVRNVLRHEREETEREIRQMTLDSRPPKMTIPVLCDDGTTEEAHLCRSDISYKWKRDTFTAATKLSYELLVFTVQELDYGAREAPRKQVLLRAMSPEYAPGGEGITGWVSDSSFRVPVSKIDWLVTTLTQAHQALKIQAQENRQAGLDARRLRSPGEAEEEKTQREAWTEKRGSGAWRQAVSLVNRHKNSAVRLGLQDHFSAWEWLGLCEHLGFRCPLCGLGEGEVYPEKGLWEQMRVRPGELMRLQPHHRRELHRGGDNSIRNILPVCRDCHSTIHQGYSRRLNAAPGWLENERSLASDLLPGMLVTRLWEEPRQIGTPESPQLPKHFPPSWWVGVIVAVKQPEVLSVGLGADSTDTADTKNAPYSNHRQRFGVVMESMDVSVWAAGSVLVQWWTSERNHQECCDASVLFPLDQDTSCWFSNEWTQAQNALEPTFTVGALVRPVNTQRTHRSEILEILPPDATMLLPVRAVIRNTVGRNERRTVPLMNLVKTGK